MTDSSALRPGQIITIFDGRQAIVRFVGTTAFAPGGWVGIELQDESGKNDGSVQGERYFDCAMGKGMFLRPSAVTEIVEQPRPPEAKTNGKPVNGTAVKGRPSSIVSSVAAGAAKRQSLLGSSAASKRMSMNAASPTPGARGAGSGLRAVRVGASTWALCGIC
jgi:dynactin 1